MGRRRDGKNADLSDRLYRRTDSKFIWFRYQNVSGAWKGASSNEEGVPEALKVMRATDRAIEAKRQSGAEDDGPLTFERYVSAKFLPAVKVRNPGNAQLHEDNLAHALPALGRLLLDEVRRHHVIDMVRELDARKDEEGRKVFAPRTVLHVYGSVRVVFRDALVREIIDVTPCTLSTKHGELPKKRDRDPRWRKTALFDREEVSMLIFDERVPLNHRVYYAIKFFTGLRDGEAIPRRFEDWDRTAKPLGKLFAPTAVSPKMRVSTSEKGTKTDLAREIPVHPMLAAILAEWRLSGWARTYGRIPGPSDYIVPRVPMSGAPLGPLSRMESKRPYQWMNGLTRKGRANTPGDLERLGLRHRRSHDTRRTFVSLAEDDGARSEVLKYISHGPSETQAYSLYRTYSWKTQCKEIRKLKIPTLQAAAKRRKSLKAEQSK